MEFSVGTMLLAILALYFQHHAQTGVYTFNLLELYGTTLTPGAQGLLFAAFAVATRARRVIAHEGGELKGVLTGIDFARAASIEMLL